MPFFENDSRQMQHSLHSSVIFLNLREGQFFICLGFELFGLPRGRGSTGILGILDTHVVFSLSNGSLSYLKKDGISLKGTASIGSSIMKSESLWVKSELSDLRARSGPN
jgi:hypothetical protein